MRLTELSAEPRLDYIAILEANGAYLVPSGQHYFMMVCPFHDDSTPSLSVDGRDGSWRCFGCHEKGEFHTLLTEFAGDDPVMGYYKKGGVSEIRDAIKNVLDPHAFYGYNWESFHKRFPDVYSTKGREYCESRGLTPKTMADFHLCWGEGGKWDRRVVIPIVNTWAYLMSYSGRAIDKGKNPKTRKSRSPYSVLFGLHEWRLHSLSLHHKVLVVVEGEWDAMYLQQFDIPAVAQMGTLPLSKDQLSLLVSNTDMVVFAYDGDEAGRVALTGRRATKDKTAVVGNFEIVSRYKPTLYVELDEGRDPNDLTPKEVLEIFGKWRLVSA